MRILTITVPALARNADTGDMEITVRDCISMLGAEVQIPIDGRPWSCPLKVTEHFA